MCAMFYALSAHELVIYGFNEVFSELQSLMKLAFVDWMLENIFTAITIWYNSSASKIKFHIVILHIYHKLPY